MPKPVPLNFIFDVAVSYIIKRQQQGRPTTLRQLSKRVGVGVSTVLRYLDEEKVNYYTFSFEKEGWSSDELEIAIRTMPESSALRARLTVSEIEESYRRIFGDQDPWKKESLTLVATKEDGAVETQQVTVEKKTDPYALFRIGSEEFREMKKKLLTYDELLAAAKEKGVPGSAILRAIGGDRLKLPMAGPAWRPYVYKNHRYYHKEVLKHLNEAFATYKWEGYGKQKEKAAKEIVRELRQQAAERELDFEEAVYEN